MLSCNAQEGFMKILIMLPKKVAFYVCMYCALNACAASSGTQKDKAVSIDSQNKGQTKQSLEHVPPTCINSPKMFFSCQKENLEFSLCATNDNKLLFQEHKSGELQNSFQGLPKKDFQYESYTRYMVSSEVVKFNNKNTAYEIFEYHSEEKQNEIHEYGVTITNPNNKAEKIICKKAKSSLYHAFEE